jgi:hypothetical protein
VLALLVLLFFGWYIIASIHFVSIWSKVPVDILSQGSVYTGGWDQGFVTASGTWVLDGEKHAFPINMSEIQCFKENSRCYAAGARLSNNYLVAELDFYNVTKWDNSTLEFVTDARCVSYVYVINRNTEKLTGRRVAKTTDDPTCKSLLVRRYFDFHSWTD